MTEAKRITELSAAANIPPDALFVVVDNEGTPTSKAITVENLVASMPTGPSGPVGLSGWTGMLGEPGDTGGGGDDGVLGLDGGIGRKGVTGVVGELGERGPTGPDNTGLIGLTGVQGPPGLPGNATGAPGPQGRGIPADGIMDGVLTNTYPTTTWQPHPNASIPVVGGRLSASTDGVSQEDVSSDTLYYVPGDQTFAGHNFLSVPDTTLTGTPTAFVVKQIDSPISLTLLPETQGFYDVFAYLMYGVVHVDLRPWSGTTRPAAATLRGCLVNNASFMGVISGEIVVANGGTYLGSIYVETPGLLSDTQHKRFVINHHNRVPRTVAVISPEFDSPDMPVVYSWSEWRPDGTSEQAAFLVPLAYTQFRAHGEAVGYSTSSSTSFAMGIGYGLDPTFTPYGMSGAFSSSSLRTTASAIAEFVATAGPICSFTVLYIGNMAIFRASIRVTVEI